MDDDLPNFCDHYDPEQLKSIFCALQTGTFLPNYETSVVLQKMILDIWSRRTGSEFGAKNFSPPFRWNQSAKGERLDPILERPSVLVNTAPWSKNDERQRKN
jgi:hypothetical protein